MTSRSLNYWFQVRASLLYKFLGTLLSFLVVPILIGYLGHEKYGIWSTFLTVFSWIIFFDFGLGNGLKNFVAKSIAENDIDAARSAISISYTSIAFFCISLITVMLALNAFFSWQIIFNTTSVVESELRVTFQIVFCFVAFNFCLGLVSALLAAVQKTSLVVFGQFFSSLITLILVYLCDLLTKSSMINIALVYITALTIPNVFLNFYFFRLNPNLIPKFRFNLNAIKPLLNSSLYFFVLQLASIVIFSSDRMIITQLFGPAYVTQYDVIFKLSSVILILQGLMAAPLWPAYTEAYAKNDISWIRSALNKQLMIFLGLVVCLLIITILSPKIIEIWIGHNLFVDFQLTFAMLIMMVLMCWNTVFSVLLNGIDHIKTQTIIAVIAMILNIPLALFLATNFEIGVAGVVWANILCLLPAGIVLPLQTFKLIYKVNNNSFG